jgi:hypothetical protein
VKSSVVIVKCEKTNDNILALQYKKVSKRGIQVPGSDCCKNKTIKAHVFFSYFTT